MHTTLFTDITPDTTLPQPEEFTLLNDATKCIKSLADISQNTDHLRRARYILCDQVKQVDAKGAVAQIFDELNEGYRTVLETAPRDRKLTKERIGTFLELHRGCTARLLALQQVTKPSTEIPPVVDEARIDDDDLDILF